MAIPEPTPNDPEYILYQQYQRQVLRKKILIAIAIGIPLLLSAGVLIPGLIAKKKGKQTTSAPEPGKTVATGVVGKGKSHGGGPKNTTGSQTSRPGQETLEIEVGQTQDDGSVLELRDLVKERIAETDAAQAAALKEQEAGPGDPLEGLMGKELDGPDRMIPVTFPADQHSARAEEIDQLLEGYAAATTVEDRAKYVLYPERVLPMMEEFYARPNASFETIGPRVDRQFYVVKGISEYAIQTHRHPSEGLGALQFIGIRHTDSGFRIDWESLVGYCDKTWDQLLEEKPTEPVRMRCFLKADRYHNFEFSNSGIWQSYLLQDQGNSHHLYGFAKRDGEIFEKLTKVLRGRPKDSAVPVLIDIHYNPDTKSKRCVLISEVIQETWLQVK